MYPPYTLSNSSSRIGQMINTPDLLHCQYLGVMRSHAGDRSIPYTWVDSAARYSTAVGLCLWYWGLLSNFSLPDRDDRTSEKERRGNKNGMIKRRLY